MIGCRLCASCLRSKGAFDSPFCTTLNSLYILIMRCASACIHMTLDDLLITRPSDCRPPAARMLRYDDARLRRFAGSNVRQVLSHLYATVKTHT